MKNINRAKVCDFWAYLAANIGEFTSFEPTVLFSSDRFDMWALTDCISVMVACPKDGNPINVYDAMHLELHFSVGA